jgi:hypothetical protein
MADGLELVHELGMRQELRHGAERQPAKVLIETRGDDARSASGKVERRGHDSRIEELHLVDPDDVVSRCERDELRDRRDGYRGHAHSSVADDICGVIPVVDPGLEDDDVLPRDLRAPEPPDHFLALAAEHGAADDLEPAAALRGNPDHGAILEGRSAGALQLKDARAPLLHSCPRGGVAQLVRAAES